MKTSDPVSYSHIQQITASNNVLEFKAFLITTDSTSFLEPQQIVGTSWEKDNNGSFKTMSYIADMSRFGEKTQLAQISFRTITSIPATINVYGLR